MSSTQTKFATATGNPSAIVIPASLSGTITIPTDTSLTGANLSPEAATFATLVTISIELLQDAKANLAYYVLTRLAQGLAQAVDYYAFMANGAVDTTNGGMTGIFSDNTIATVNAAQGNTTVAQLTRADFMAVVAAVSPAALQRECLWYVSPALLPALLLLVDGTPAASNCAWHRPK
jgi:HK97 family phage major capsid protein